MTSDLVKRIWQHKNNSIPSFSEKYQIHILVYYELHETMLAAISREKQLKKWNRDWKVKMVEGFNHNWNDLYSQVIT